MKIRPITKPSGIIVEEKNEKYGRFVLAPLERGYGITIGHALRRMLLSSVQGAAITAVKIEGIYHEFATVPGVYEDVPQILLNLKKVRVRVLGGDVPKQMTLKKEGEGIVKAGDIEAPHNLEIVNPDQHIATLGEDGALDITMLVDIGKGYVPQEMLKGNSLGEGTLFLDTNFSPVVRVKYRVEDERVGFRTDYERLILEVWTDGSVYPEEAVSLVSRIIKEHMDLISFVEGFEETGEEKQESLENIEEKKILLQKKVEELGLNNRIMNVLKPNKIETVADLVSMTEEEMIKLKGFGKTSLKELKEILEGYGLELGMDVKKYIGGKK